MIKLVVFDWAGTTVDYGCMAPVYAFKQAFESFGICVTMQEIRAPMGLSKIDHIKAMLKMSRINNEWQMKYKEFPVEANAKEIYKIFENSLLKTLADFATPKKYAIDVVNELRKNNIHIGSTTGYTKQMMQIVEKGAEGFGFKTDYIVTPEDVQNLGRPYPYMIFENMKKFKIESVSQVIKIGDTVADILEGKNAGVKTLGVIEGSSVMGFTESEFKNLSDAEKQNQIQIAKEKFINAGADAVVYDLKELLEYINAAK